MKQKTVKKTMSGSCHVTCNRRQRWDLETGHLDILKYADTVVVTFC